MKLPFSVLLLTLALWPALVWADPQSELASFSAFPQIDLHKLDQGQTEQARGNLMQFQRGISAQSAFLLDAPLATVAERILNWDTSQHKELKVYVHGFLSPATAPTAASFSALRTLPENRSTAYLIDYTTKIAPGFHEILVNQDEQKLWSGSYASRATDKESKKNAVLDYWSQVLAGRVNLFLSGNYASDAGAYDSSDEGRIHAFEEVNAMLHADGKINQQFSGLLAQTPFESPGKVGTPAQLYYECYDIQGQAALGTGAVYLGKQTNSTQIVDVEYYENYGVYTVIEMHQLWPVTIDGKEKTLVWRTDMVSAPEIAGLHGVERQASSLIMLQEVKQSIDVFRTEFK